MKPFWIVLATGAGLIGLSVVFSFLGSAASQPSDIGVIAGGLFVILLLAAATAIGVRVVKNITKEKP